jgi:glycosyltransferase involved in cell wall biosynthesis
MRINIVMGFFLPVPPLAGGASEKSWYGLAREFAVRGHEVTIICREWPGQPSRESIADVNFVRIQGHHHTSSLTRNLWLDFQWSLRVWRALKPADITIANCIALPLWLGSFPRGSGRVVVMPGRMPKGQFRLYRRLHRVIAVSSVVRTAVLKENPRLAPLIRLFGYPINWRLLASQRPTRTEDAPLTIGYIGRLNREKGLELLADATVKLAKNVNLPPWRLLLCGPADVAHGGSGPEFAAALRQRLAVALSAEQFCIQAPEFSEQRLAAIYGQIDIFCYPSLAVHGETFGVAVAEAMGAGAVPVVSSLENFADFVRPEESGVVFDQTAPDAADRLANALAGLMTDATRRRRLAAAAQAAVQAYDYPTFAARLLADLSTLLPAGHQ